MIGIVIVTHSTLAREFLSTAEMIIGPIPLAEAISIEAGASVDQTRDALQNALSKVSKDGEGSIILTDMFGGTPTNISADFLQEQQVEILTGINLPMLLKCASARSSQELSALTVMLKDYAQKAVVRPAELLQNADSASRKMN